MKYIVKVMGKMAIMIIFLLPITSGAYDFNYNYVEISYSSTTVEAFPSDIDGNVTGIEGSLDITNNTAIFVGYFSGSTDAANFIPEIDTTEIDLGVTLHTGIAEKTDGFLLLALVKGELKGGIFGPGPINEDDTGLGARLGLRHALGEKVELTADLTYVDVFDSSTTGVGVGAIFNISNTISLLAGYSTDDDVDAIDVAVRVYF